MMLWFHCTLIIFILYIIKYSDDYFGEIVSLIITFSRLKEFKMNIYKHIYYMHTIKLTIRVKISHSISIYCSPIYTKT